ncbi:MAG: recombinase family protein [Corynebacterium casei]|uniref:recombinase family protein n=1 Tax=Corynebacterium casei TaxID=160386 RepID=UPI001CEC3E6A
MQCPNRYPVDNAGSLINKQSSGHRNSAPVLFLKEGQTYSLNSTPIAKLMLGLLGSVAEFERSIIRERQAEGIARAKARGVYKGRAKVLSDEQLAQAREWVGGGVPKAEVARRLGIGRTTLYNYLSR